MKEKIFEHIIPTILFFAALLFVPVALWINIPDSYFVPQNNIQETLNKHQDYFNTYDYIRVEGDTMFFGKFKDMEYCIFDATQNKPKLYPAERTLRINAPIHIIHSTLLSE